MLSQDDIFEKENLVNGAHGKVQDVNELDSPQEVPEGFDELPIELISLIDRWVSFFEVHLNRLISFLQIY